MPLRDLDIGELSAFCPKINGKNGENLFSNCSNQRRGLIRSTNFSSKSMHGVMWLFTISNWLLNSTHELFPPNRIRTKEKREFLAPDINHTNIRVTKQINCEYCDLTEFPIEFKVILLICVSFLRTWNRQNRQNWMAIESKAALVDQQSNEKWANGQQFSHNSIGQTKL